MKKSIKKSVFFFTFGSNLACVSNSMIFLYQYLLAIRRNL